MLALDSDGASSSAKEPVRSRLDKAVLATALHNDLFGVFQSTHDVDDALLRFFHLAQTDWSANLHLFLQCLRGARRLIAEDALLELLARAAHRQRQVLAVDVAQHA